MLMDTKMLIRAVGQRFTIPESTGPETLKNAMRVFLDGETGTFGAYVSTSNALVYRSLSTVDGYTQDVICIRLVQGGQVHYLGNSSRLSVEGTNISFGKRSRNWRETPSQALMQTIGVPMLPFRAFIEAGLKVTSTVIVDQSGPEKVKRVTGQDRNKKPKLEDVHFTGASLFQIGTKLFLFDIDREEIKHGIFNPFIVEIPKEVSTIEKAYDALIPIEVRTAMVEGKTVLRQGEHFFIKVAEQDTFTPDKEKSEFTEKVEQVRARLSAQGNRDHVCTMFNKASGLVSGEVEHMGREHKNLELKGWFKPVPNTAVRSFTISGDID